MATGKQKKFREIDENGLIGCICGKRLKPEDFPFSIYDPNKRTVSCIDCLNSARERDKKRYDPFRKQLEEERKKRPHCEISGELFEEGEKGDFDHKEGVQKIRKVSDFKFWSGSRAGKSLTDRLLAHALEIQKCQRLKTNVHVQITRDRRGELSTTHRAVKDRKKVEMIKEENWEFIREVQNGLCGCGCGVKLTPIMVIEFDHQKGKKGFEMSEARSKSKSTRAEERNKGKFLISNCHRRLTEQRLNEAQNQRTVLFRTSLTSTY